MQKKGKRMMNLEMLRCLAMMMVVVLHFLGKGNLLTPLTEGEMTPVAIAAWGLESFAIVAVNVYMLISGYLLCESSFKLSRLLTLLLQIITYSVIFGLLGAALGFVPAEKVTTYYYIQLLFPVSMGQYWFMTAYVFLYLLLPFLTVAIKRMTKEQMKIALILLLIVFCGLKSVLPIRLDMDAKGYDCLWYLCVFLTAAYVRRFGMPFLKNRRNSICLYIGACLLVFGGTMALRGVYLKTGSLSLILGIMMEYNHVLPFLASLGLFTFFLEKEYKGVLAPLVEKIGPLTLGVYLLHESLGLRYAWQPLLGSQRINSLWELVLFTVLAVIVVFCVGILVEAVRSACMKGLHNLCMKNKAYSGLISKIEGADKTLSAADFKEN